MDKKTRLELLLNMTNNVDKKNNNYIYLSDKKIEKLKEKFPILIGTIQLKNNEIKEGILIRYVDNNFTKVSIQGIIAKIDYFSELSISQIKTIHLYNRYVKTVWKIDPQKVIIFKETKKSKIAKFIANNIIIEEINKYKKSLKDKDKNTNDII